MPRNEVLRGPRPPSVRWPVASRRQPSSPQPTQNSVLRSPPVRSSPETVAEAAQFSPPSTRETLFHDDVYTVAQPERTVAVHRILGEELWQHTRIRITTGKTQIWNRGGHVPSGYETLLNEARAINPHAEVWFGGFDRHPEERGIRVLGTPFGTAEFVRSQLDATEGAHQLCFSESQQCRTCSQRGLSCCSALHHGRHFIYGCVILTTPKHSHDSMTFTLGSVSPRCWGNCMTLSHRIGAVFPSTGRTGLAQRTSFSTCRLLGQLGRLLAHYQPTSRRHCPNHVGRPRKPVCRVVSSWPR